MRRIRLSDFINAKRRRPPTTSPMPSEPQFHPPWEHDYYHFKSQLVSIQQTNREISRLLQEYHLNSTIFNLKQLQSLIKLNCRKIDEMDRWTNAFPFTNISPLQNQLENNIVKHFKQSILTQIGHVFAMREQINSVNRDIEERSFMGRPNASMSYSVLNLSQNDQMERSFAIKEVQTKIEGLNAILRKMGDIVASQGEHINRIDENLIIGHENVRKGKELLAARAARENCEEEESSTCSFSSKVNSIISTLYLVNLVLIAILVIKNF